MSIAGVYLIYSIEGQKENDMFNSWSRLEVCD